MSEENVNPQEQATGSFDPNAASYVPNSPEYEAAQQQVAEAAPVAEAEPVVETVVDNPYAQQAPAANPYEAPAQQAPVASPYAAPVANPYGEAPVATPYVAPAQQAAPYGGAPQASPYAAPQQTPYGQPVDYQQPPSTYPGQPPQGAPYQQPYGYQQPPMGVPGMGQPGMNPQAKDHSGSTKVLGILSIVAAFISPLIAFILGGLGLMWSSQDKQNFGDDRSKVGHTCSIIGIVLGVVMWVFSIIVVMMTY